MSALHLLLSIFTLGLFLSGCGSPNGHSSGQIDDTDARILTGDVNEDGLPYLNDPVIEVEKEEKVQSTEKNVNKLAHNIKNIMMYRFGVPLPVGNDLNNLKVKASTFGMQSIWIQIEKINENTKLKELLHFRIERPIVGSQKQGLKFDKIVAVENPDFLLSGEIKNSVKKESFIGKYVLTEQLGPTKSSHANIYQRFYFANVQIHGQKGGSYFEKLNSGTLFALVSNWVCTDGPAFRHVKIIKDSRNSKSQSGKASLVGYLDLEIDRLELVKEFDSPIVRTTGISLAGYPLESGLDNEDVNVGLLGQDEFSGDQLYIFDEKGENVYFEIQDASLKKIPPGLNNTRIDSENDGDTNTSLIQHPLFNVEANKQNPQIKKVLEQLNGNWEIQKIKDLALYWSGKKAEKPYPEVLSRDLMLNFFQNIRPIKKDLEKIFYNYSVPPQMSFMTLVENKFFTSKNYSFIQVNKRSTATGMYQLLKGTGKRFGLVVDQTQRNGVKPRNYDERLYFYPASCSVANMMDYYVDIFQNDATLAFLAFRLGEGAAASILECTRTSTGKSQCGRKSCSGQTCSHYLNEIKNSNIKYSHLAKYNVLPREISAWMNQVLAAYFISKDLSKYNFGETLKYSSGTGPREEVLMPPNGLIADNKCQRIITARSTNR